MNHPFEVIKTELELVVNNLNSSVQVDLEQPRNIEFGDISTNIGMKLAKELHRSPIEIATEIADQLKSREIPNIEKIEVVSPGFINFHIDTQYFNKKLNEVIQQKSDYGKSKKYSEERWEIEHTSANPNKAMHFGHLRNNVTGMAISNLWEAIGIQVIRDYVDNNRGIAIAKLMWGYLKFAKKNESSPTDINYWYEHQDEWQTPQEFGIKPDHFVDKLYNLSSEDFKNAEVEDKVRKMVVDWENEDPINWKLWELVLKYSHEGQSETLQRLGSKIDKIWYEHEHYKKGKEIVDEGIEKNIFKKLEDGAVLTDLSSYKIPDTIVLKKDGTSLYITQDLALTKLKRETFKPTKMFWVVGPDQNLALRQVFAVCDQFGFGKIEDYTHISFGYVTVKGQGKMSSRKGNVVYIDDLLDAAKEIIEEKITNEEFDEETKENISEILGIGAVKYSILKVGRTKDTAFDFKTSLSFEGDSGPYLVYTFARCKSILRNSGIDLNILKDKENTLSEKEELELAKHIFKFPEIIEDAALNYAPNIVATYLYELAQYFNQFYTKHSVLKAENENYKYTRIKLVASVAQVLQNGLNLLGIETVEKM